jgi:hypothetical protein
MRDFSGFHFSATTTAAVPLSSACTGESYPFPVEKVRKVAAVLAGAALDAGVAGRESQRRAAVDRSVVDRREQGAIELDRPTFLRRRRAS